ncbi:putative PIG3 family NAD(P)H quinone oxidoreductase [Tepidamorphus gemmatus]|uniref:Putative PIG3 family NAD(P)H quinone oxidoreductase n=1 Tax=Tepidamorphus gemmatus TaxID=747076 RepID=A0A4R3MJ28_9HYPH|nr:NAD(P)H-quinone oxidoreductase [Tepidamorphus gemmatus]TCT13333.1 putative PIG3 family NAD(P)H quinone oxidoreductase [Tepidamorphus gemmatus]
MTDMPDTMTAIQIAAPGGPEVLIPVDRPVPRPGPGELLVRVAAAGVNRPDVLQRQGVYPPPPGASDIPGLEIAGTVVAMGEGVSRFGVGEAVCALVAGGGYAEYCTVHETNALPVPAGLSMVEAAAIPETFFTVWTNVFDRAGLEAGETFLVHGGSSGIGTTAIQLARAFGATVFTTAGSPDKCAACARLGADHVIDYRQSDFVEVVKQMTGGRGVNVILDMVGGDYVARNYDAAAEDGRIVQIAFLRGAKPTVDLNALMRKRLVHTGSTLRPRSVAFKAAIARALEERVWPLIESGTVKPVIDSIFSLRDAAAAQARMDGGQHIGKIVLQTGL